MRNEIKKRSDRGIAESAMENEKVKVTDSNFNAIGLSFILDVQNGAYSKMDVLVMSILNFTSNSNFGFKSVITNTDLILSVANITKQTKNRNIVIESLMNLSKGGLIQICEDLNFTSEVTEIKSSDCLFIKLKEFNTYSENFVKVYHDDFKKIFSLGEKNPSKIYFLYVTILSGVYEKKGTHYNMATIYELSSLCDLDKKTVTRYIQILHDNELIYRHTALFKDETGARKTKGVYTRPVYRKRVEASFVDNY